MAIVAVVKPGLVSENHISAGGKIGPAGSDFFIKVRSADYDWFSPVEDVTGDGDKMPKFENNFLLYGNVKLVGAMVSNRAIGLYNLVANASGLGTKNPLGGDSGITLHTFDLGGGGAGLGSTEQFKFYLILEHIFVSFNRRAAYNAVMITGKMTNMTVTDAGPVDEIEPAD